MFLRNDVKQSLLTKIPFVIVCFQAEGFLRKGLLLKPPDTYSRLLLVQLYLIKVINYPFLYFSLTRNANSGGGGKTSVHGLPS